MTFSPSEHMVQQILYGIDGLKEHKMHQVADAGYCEFAINSWLILEVSLIGEEVGSWYSQGCLIQRGLMCRK